MIEKNIRICANTNCSNLIVGRSHKRYCSRKCKEKVRWRRKYREHKRYKKNQCELCGFIPIHECQLDVDHIDGNHKNNTPNNLQTLCANCHRLKTHNNKDWMSIKVA